MILLLHSEKHQAMSKNVIHNFNLSIKNSADIKSSEHLTETIIKELAKVSKEMSQQKDIVQLWQEQKNQNATAILNNSIASAEGSAIDTTAVTMQNPMESISNTPSALEVMKNSNVSTGIGESGLFTTSTTVPIEGGAADNTLRTEISSFVSNGITPSIIGDQDLTNQVYSGISAQQSLMVPESLQVNGKEPSVEVIKAGVKKKLDAAVIENDTESIKYWTTISKAFDQGATVFDFDGKPDHILFSQMYAELKQLNSSSIAVQNFNWEVVREKMIKAIDANILKGSISIDSKKRWETIKRELANDKTNIANLFEQYDELFLLLKEVEGLDTLPTTITITTKTKIYPNLNADNLYADIGKEAVYGFLKLISETNFEGSAVNKGAVKIKNTKQTSFIIGESLEFFVDEAFINQINNQKENINWVVYNNGTKKENIFKNEGTSFSYNFDTPGTYRIDAYGKKYTVNQKKSAKTATFIELKIIAQEIVITPPANAAGEFIRPFNEEKNLKISLKHTAVKTLNPLKLYYHVESTTTDKITKISDQQELDSAGIIKLAMSDLGTYKIKVFSKDQYGLFKEFKTSVIKNEVTSIALAQDSLNNNVFLLGIPNKEIILEAKKFKINPPTDEEKEDVRWMIYDSNNKPYLAPGTVLFTDKKDPRKSYMHNWKEFTMPIPQNAGHYTVEAFSDSQKGAKSECVYKMEVKHPEVTEAYWTWSGGSKKNTSGFSGESNYIKAQIPHYENQKVRVYFYLNNAKTSHYIDVKTNGKGQIFEEVKFDAVFQKAIGFNSGKNANVGFKLLGIQNSKPYPFNTPANYESDTILSVTTDTKILDVYFTYDGIRVNPFLPVPYGAKVMGIIKTLNMVGSEVVLKVRRKNAQHSQLKMKTIVKSEGEASITFVLDKKWRPITPLFGFTDSYYLGMEGIESKFYLENGLNAVLNNAKKNEEVNKYGIDIPYFLAKYKGESEANLKVLLNDMNEYYTSEKIMPQKEQVAYILATVYTETFRTFKPIVESFWISDKNIREKTYHRYDPILADSDKRRKTAIERGNTTEGDGVKYCGRGYVQLTWKNNYKKIKNQFGIDVVNYPDKVLEPKLAAKIMIWGINEGIFTGVSINNYINNIKTDYVNARKVINGTDRDDLIANDAEKFEKDLKIIQNSENQYPVSKTLTAALEEMKVIADKHLAYAMEENTGASKGLRTSLNDNALSKMDCSEFVCRYLHKLAITKEVKWVTTASMTSESSFQKALGTDKIKFVGNSKDFKPQAGDIFVWRSGGGGHTGIVYKYDNSNDLVTILEAIGPSGSRDNETNKKNGGYALANCTRASVYKSKGEALFAHPGFIGYFRPQKL
jgi:predicted chitinase